MLRVRELRQHQRLLVGPSRTVWGPAGLGTGAAATDVGTDEREGGDSAARLPEIGAEPLHLAVSASPRSLGRIRRALEGLGLSELTLRDAVLLTTELVTNSVRHAGLDPEDLIEIHVDRYPGRLRVAVQDGGSWVPPDGVAGSIRPAPGAESGWGLYLVERLATRWGTHRNGGVWFELEEPAPGGRSA